MNIFLEMPRVFFALLAIALIAASVNAAPGDLDPTFGGTGKVRIAFGGGRDSATSVATQSDGKIVVAGNTQVGERTVITVLRYNADGSIDTSFKGSDQAYPDSSFVSSIKIQPNDGKIVGAGNDGHSFFIFRLLATDGSLDPSFGVGGKVITPLGENEIDTVNAMAISDGKIVVAGSADRSASIALARYDSDGLLDPSFHGDGKVITAIGNQGSYANAIVISGTNIVVAGATQNGTYNAFVVLSYLENGSLDPSFNNGTDGPGYVVTPVGTTGASARAVAIQPGRLGQPNTIVVAGNSSNPGNNSDFTLVRYFFDGTRDTTFGSNGIVTTDVGTNTFDFATALLIQNTGTPANPSYKIVIGGSVNFSSNTDSFVLARYNSNGSLDTAFDGDGMVITTFGGSTERCQALAFSGSKIVAVGVGEANQGITQPGDFAVARYTANGSLDPTFDGDGKRLDDAGEAFEGAAKAVAIQPDGKVVVAGSLLVSVSPPLVYPGLIRLDPNGTLDPSFGRGTGKVIGGLQDTSIAGMAIGGDGRIALVGSRTVFHFDASGVSDAVKFPIPGEARAVAIQPDGKIVVAGYTSNSSGQDLEVVRFQFDASGFLQPDATFGSNGVVSTDLGAANDVANAVALQPDGKIVVAGTSGQDFAAVRLNPNGSLDTSFNGTGIVRQSFQIESDGKTLAIQSDGKIIVAGRVATFIGMVRFTGSGAPDSAFGGNGTGKVVTDLGPNNAGAESLAIQTDGKILVAGTGGPAGPDFVLLRYNSNGSPDISYGDSGKVLIDFRAGSSDFGHAVALDGTGRAVVAGEAAGVFGVARLQGDTAIPTPTPTPTATATPTPGSIGNISTRLPVGTGDNALIEGFIVQGPAGSTKKIIVRAIGPSLAAFGIQDALGNPTLEIHDANDATVASNDDWKNTHVGGLISGDQSAAIASSGVPPSNDLESAIIADLAPGSYTAVVRGTGNTTGTGVVDAYDLSAGSSARLANIATRGLIQPGDKLMIAGFIIQDAPVRAVVRAIGPSLSAFGITNALPDTTLQLRDSNGAIVRENDDWQTDQEQELESTGLQPTDDHEAALVATIPPGQYTAQVRGKPETTGIGVVQIYFLQ